MPPKDVKSAKKLYAKMKKEKSLSSNKDSTPDAESKAVDSTDTDLKGNQTELEENQSKNGVEKGVDAKPETKAEAEPGTKAEAEPEAKTEVEPEAKTEVASEAKTEVKSEAKTGATPSEATQPEVEAPETTPSEVTAQETTPSETTAPEPTETTTTETTSPTTTLETTNSNGEEVKNHDVESDVQTEDNIPKPEGKGAEAESVAKTEPVAKTESVAKTEPVAEAEPVAKTEPVAEAEPVAEPKDKSTIAEDHQEESTDQAEIIANLRDENETLRQQISFLESKLARAESEIATLKLSDTELSLSPVLETSERGTAGRNRATSFVEEDLYSDADKVSSRSEQMDRWAGYQLDLRGWPTQGRYRIISF